MFMNGKDMQAYPSISVMMCAYNAARYIREAIDSVLNQSYNDFEFIIVDDGSADNTCEIIQSFTDSRIRLINGKHNYIASLNAGMRACRGDFIARMDADDKMQPERLEKQIEVMHKSADIAVCFSWSVAFGEREGLAGYFAKEKVDNAFFWLLTGNYLMHPTSMLRASFLKKYRIRYKNYPYAEDYKLWMDISRVGGEFYVIPEPLMLYRIYSAQVSNKYHAEQSNTRLLIQQEIIEELIKRMPLEEKQIFSRLYQQTLYLNQMNLMQGKEIVALMYKLFCRTELYMQKIS